MYKRSIFLMAVVAALGLFPWNSQAEAAPPASCSEVVFTHGFDALTPTACPRAAQLDYFGNGRTDFSTLTATSGQPLRWTLRSNGFVTTPRVVDFGPLTTSVFAGGDFSGDGQTKIGIYDTSLNSFRYLTSSTGSGTEVSVPWGATGDQFTAVGDYDCDGKSDMTFVRNVGGTFLWGIRLSSTLVGRFVSFGDATTDVPLVGMDWNGDSCDDLGTVRIANNGDFTFRIGNATTGALLLQQDWGNFNTDYIVPGDFLGDERADFAVWRGFGAGTSGEWLVKENGGTRTMTVAFGMPGASGVRDTALRGDYDGDGKDDFAVKVNGSNLWRWRRSSDGFSDLETVGTSSDLPIPANGVF